MRVDDRRWHAHCIAGGIAGNLFSTHTGPAQPEDENQSGALLWGTLAKAATCRLLQVAAFAAFSPIGLYFPSG